MKKQTKQDLESCLLAVVVRMRIPGWPKQHIKMASSMSGMFSGQQPTGAHPVGGPGGQGQPGFPVAAPRAQGGNTLVDELEASFEVGIYNLFKLCVLIPISNGG